MPTFTFTSPEGQTHSIEGPEGATREQAFQVLQLKLGAQPAPPAAPQESTVSDMFKSADAGIGKGLTAVLGLPGDAATLAHSVAPQSVIDKVKGIPGAKFLYNHLPGSEAIKSTIPTDFSANYNKDAEYDPQTAPGRYTKAVATQVPMMATGMGAVPAVAAGVAGQAAYDATGSHLAEAGANLAGGVASSMAAARLARQAMMPLHDAPQVKGIANAQYADPLLRDTTIAPQAVGDVADAMRQQLASSRSRFAPAQAPQVHQALDTLEASVRPPQVGPPAPVSIEDLHSFRKSLGEIGRETRDFKPTEQATAAGTVKRVLDQYLDNIPSRDVARGNPIDAVDALRNANGNWRASSNATKVNDLIGNAVEQAAGQHSGNNLGNVLRQKFQPLLKNDAAKLRAMGHDDAVIDGVRQVTRGDALTNTLRRASNMLGGGGGIASTIVGHGLATGAGGAAGYQQGGLGGMLAGTLAGTVPGQALRLMSNARTLSAARRVQEQMLSMAPANRGIVARNNAAQAANAAARNAAVLQNLPNVLRQAIMLNQHGR